MHPAKPVRFSASGFVSPLVGQHKSARYAKILQQSIDKHAQAFEQLPHSIEKVEFTQPLTGSGFPTEFNTWWFLNIFAQSRATYGKKTKALIVSTLKGTAKEVELDYQGGQLFFSRKKLDQSIQKVLQIADQFGQGVAKRIASNAACDARTELRKQINTHGITNGKIDMTDPFHPVAVLKVQDDAMLGKALDRIKAPSLGVSDIVKGESDFSFTYNGQRLRVAVAQDDE